MFIYLLLPSCEGKYKERAKTWELNISFRLVNHKIIFSSRETLAETLFTGRWRQTDNSASLWSRFSPVGHWTAAQGGVGTSCDYHGNNPEPCMESHLKKNYQYVHPKYEIKWVKERHQLEIKWWISWWSSQYTDGCLQNVGPSRICLTRSLRPRSSVGSSALTIEYLRHEYGSRRSLKLFSSISLIAAYSQEIIS